MQASIWLQTKTLVKRNAKIKWRVKQASIQEIVMPIYFIVLLALLKSFAYKPTAYGPTSSENITINYISSNVSRDIYVAPNSTEVTKFVEKLKEVMPESGFRIFEDQVTMDSAYKNSSTRADASRLVGILFQDSITKYALRFPYGTLSGSTTDLSQGNCRSNAGQPFTNCPANNFFTSGFTSVQSAVDTALGRMNNSDFSMNIYGRYMPKEGTVANTEAFMIVGPLYLVMALGPYLTFLLVFIVYEKEKKIKEGMKMMGLDNLAYWFSWSIVYSLSLLVMTIVMTLIGYFGGLWGNSNFFLVFLLIYIYGQSIQMLAYMLTPFFNKAKTAGAVGGFLTIILSLLFLAIELTDDFPEPAVWAVSLISPAAFAIVMGKVFYFEVAGEGAHFSNIGVGPNPMYIGLVMMLVDIVLYFFLTLYLDAVVPSEYGQRESPFFCLRPSFWLRRRRGIQRSRSVRATNYETDNFESVSQDQIGNEAITFQGIRKVFQKKSLFGSSSETVAIKNFSLDIYKGQITALLGHNGAGKTTLFNILTGFVPATSGSATVYGYNVNDSNDMSEIRKMTGVCPQHDILIEMLSVIEHLEVFAGLKGFQGEELKEEANRVMKIIDLEDQKNTYAKKLSGGQKRKLSVGIAIMGDPKILILDEPTAGMDPYSRRKLWDLLRSNQHDRVTLLTTHFMDEADILADRKAILTKGRLRCVGSSLFLKNRFGVGYHLGIVSKSHHDADEITKCVTNHIEDAELQRSIGMEHAYTLPINQVTKFPDLFTALDKQQEQLGVQSYGVSMTTLEEVFLKIGEDDDDEEDNRNGDSKYRATYIASGKDVNEGHTNPEIVLDGETTLIEVDSIPKFDPSKSEIDNNPSDLRILLQLVRRTLLLHLRNPGFVIFGILLPIVLEIVGAYVYTQAGSTSDGNDPAIYDMTYQNNLGSYVDKNQNTISVLYSGLTGTANSSFLSNVLPGVPMQASALDDTTLFSFWPHAVGLNLTTFNGTQASYLALYNTSFVRSLPSAINIVSNSLLRNANGDAASNIVVYSKSWPQNAAALGSTFNGSAFTAALLISMAIVLPTALAAANPVKERETKVKTQLRVSGVRFFTYWFAYLLGDYVVFFVMSVIYIICIFAFQVTGLNNAGAAGALILLLIGWGVACLLTSYTASFLFDRFDSVQASWPGIAQLMCILPYICVSTLDLTGNRDAAVIANVIFLIVSPYYVGFSGVFYCFRIYITYLAREEADNIPASAYFDWSEPMLPLSIVMAYVHIVIFSILLLIADISKHGGDIKFWNRNSQVGSSEWRRDEVNDDVDPDEDDDVSREREKVRNNAQSTSTGEPPVVVMDGLRKEFVKQTGKSCQSCRQRKDDDDDEEETTKVAVRNLSMTVYPGEVVGLLGPNGAGKTTALNVLIADIGATRGKVHIGGERITSSLSEAFKAMGYCPQTNPLWNTITLQEHLEIYSAVRGVPPDKVQEVIFNFMEALDIIEHKDKRAKHLSGGTKRKLCFAISMLGNPKVVLLDEPSTGMDPKTKRFLWNTISTAFEGTKRGAILTTHYMEEADALCSRVGIMVLGQLRCLGSTQHLKGKFGQGYILEIKLEGQQQHSQESDEESGEHVDNPDSPLEIFIKEMFPTVDQPERFGNRWTYKINREDVTSLSTVFVKLEEAKVQFGIEEYSFSQSTLEQVFLRFAKEQAENDEEEQQRQEEKKRLKKLKKK